MKGNRRQRRLVVMLDEDAYELLARLTTPRRKGGYLSDLIRRAAGAKAGEHPEGMQLLQGIEASLERIEKKLNAAAGEEPDRKEDSQPPALDSDSMR
jgi:hypothetical protein